MSAGPTDGPWAQREASLQRIRKVGRREWQKESGYRQQARVENSFFRYKSVFGGGLKARHSKAQRREAAAEARRRIKEPADKVSLEDLRSGSFLEDKSTRRKPKKARAARELVSVD